ncbi:MAG: NERD domain-containing protein [Proteobacteria bacterium]|nr:NERD domain-containing protein [Pseudomonadota bacterium]
MAIFPQGLSHVDARCNAGERRVLHQLKRCLGDDYLVWHDIAIGPMARQPDFVILSPRWGVLLLEVKDWKRSTLGPATRDAIELATPRGRVTQPHPLRQVRDHALELADLMQRDPALVHGDGPFRGRLLFPWGYGIVMASLRRADVEGGDFDAVFPPARTLLRDDLDEALGAEAFQHRLWGMFTVSYPHTLTLPQRDRIRWHLFPEIRLPQQGSLLDDDAPNVPDLLQVMDLQQEQIARTLGEGHRVIHGVAGSGKTMILVYRAQQLALAVRPERPILVLCYNRALAGRIDAMLRARGVDERVVVRTFHAWCEDLVRAYQLHVPADRRAADYWPVLAGTLTRAVETGFVPGGQYAALLVDEAHDFEEAWLQVAARMVDPATRSLLVLYDDVQSIYRRRRFSLASVGIDAVGRTSILRLNYRNTAEVLALAVHCAQSLLESEQGAADEWQPVLPSTAGRHGPMPVLVEARDERAEAEAVAERIAAAHADGRPLGDIAILTRSRQAMPAFERALARRGLATLSMAQTRPRRDDWLAQSVRIMTLHSAKGLEFPLVFVAGLQAMPWHGEPIEEEMRLLYVAMTRATHALVCSAHGASPMVERVRASLVAVAARPAA